jgi:hypothetical protein
MTITATLAIACALLLLGRYLNGMASTQYSRRVAGLRLLAVHAALEILRLLQQHRGLGALSDVAALTLRSAIAANLTQRLQQRAGLPDSYLLTEAWLTLRETPTDFESHSVLIETVIDSLAQRAWLNHEGATVAQTCRELEAVARLRGLCVIASMQGGCTPAMQGRLEMLCRRIGSGVDMELKRLVGKLERNVVHSAQPRLSPPECFALVTPLIDARLQLIQQRLQHSAAQAQRGLPGGA